MTKDDIDKFSEELAKKYGERAVSFEKTLEKEGFNPEEAILISAISTLKLCNSFSAVLPKHLDDKNNDNVLTKLLKNELLNIFLQLQKTEPELRELSVLLLKMAVLDKAQSSLS